MSKIVSKEIKCENFTINDVAEQLVEAIGTDKKVDAAFIVIRTEGKQAVIPMGDALKQLGLLSSGSIEKAVKETSEFVKNEISKRFNQFLDEIADRHNSNEGGVA